jgi:hypothetical protein
MCNITRRLSKGNNALGYYNLQGSISTRYNYEYTGHIFNGTLGLHYTEELQAGKTHTQKANKPYSTFINYLQYW